MLNVNNIALFSLAAGSALAAPFRLQQRAASGLNTAAVAAGKLYFGTATDNGELSDVDYKAILDNTADFGQITPANGMKWDSIEPSRDTFNFTKGDVIADLAATNGQMLRCHNLVWYNQLPSWVSNGGFDNATLVEILQNHITKEVTHYKGKCYAWDVVNEAISDNGDGSWRDNVFYKTIGEAYIPIAFAAAAAADPDAKLYYNDYSIESAGSKSTAAQDIVKLIQSYGAKIDGVGLQAHFIVGSTPSTESQVANMKAFTDLGVDVAITELDIRTSSPDNTAYQAQQAEDYASTIKACNQIERCVGVTLWDFADEYSWVPSTFSGQGAACPWDEQLNKKPAYDAMIEAFGGAATTVTSAAAVASKPVISSSAAATTVAAVASSEAAAPSTSAAAAPSASSVPASSSQAATTSVAPTSTASAAAYTTSSAASSPASSASSVEAPVSTFETAASSSSTAAPAAPTSTIAESYATSSTAPSSATESAPTESAPTSSAASTSSITAPVASESAPASYGAPSTSASVVSPLPTTAPTDDGECEVKYVYVDA